MPDPHRNYIADCQRRLVLRGLSSDQLVAIRDSRRIVQGKVIVPDPVSANMARRLLLARQSDER